LVVDGDGWDVVQGLESAEDSSTFNLVKLRNLGMGWLGLGNGGSFGFLDLLGGFVLGNLNYSFP